VSVTNKELTEQSLPTLPKSTASITRTLSARRPLDQSIARCNSAQSNHSSPVEFWPTRERHDPPTNELRSIREQ
jgi:hypothetical protein